MAKTFIIFIATALATVPSIIASSIHNYELNTRNSVACTDPHAAIDPSCWKTLALTDWLRAWDTKTPTCTGQDTSACCAQHEPWSTCFLRLAENYAGSSCYNIDGCLYGGAQLSSNLPAYDLPRYHYIIYNIYAVNHFFSTWYHALKDAFSQSSSAITSIIETVDPTQKTNVGLSDVLLALSFGLAFTVAPELGAMADATTKVVGHLFNTLLQQAPGVGRALWPKGTVDSQLYQIGQLNTVSQQVIAGVENNLNAGLQAVQGDLETFIQFTSSGAFSVPEDQRPSLPNQTQGLLVGLTTFLVSSALKSNGFLASIVTGVDPEQMTTNSSLPLPCWATWNCANECSHRDLKCQSYDTYTHCDRWYYSRRFNSAFTLGSTTKYDQNPSDLLNKILSNNWTTGALLFENAALCNIPSSISNNTAITKTIWNMPYNPRWWTTLTDAVAVNVFDVGDRAIRDIMYIYNTQNKYDTCHEDMVGQNRSLINTNPPSITTNHPNNTLFNFGPSGPDFSCTSQLDLSFVTTWHDVANGLYY